MRNLHNRLNNFVLALGLLTMTTAGFRSVIAAVKTTPSSKTDLASINTDMIDSPVEVEATVKSITPPREGSNAPYRFSLADATGVITLVIWPDLYETVKTQTPLSTGDVIHVSAKVSMYRDSLQLQIHDASDLKIITKAPQEKTSAAETVPSPSPTAPKPESKPNASTPLPQPAAPGTTSLESLTPAMIGQDVTVQAAITEVREPRSEKAPYIVTLTQNNAHIPFVYWSDMQPQLKEKVKVGNQVRLNAQVTEYRGTLQLKIRSASDLTAVSAP
jgi:DNA/RNA endonuclease YhcR with UshA esterase domain